MATCIVPMSANGEIDVNGDLWFFTGVSSHKVSEVAPINGREAQPFEPGCSKTALRQPRSIELRSGVIA